MSDRPATEGARVLPHTRNGVHIRTVAELDRDRVARTLRLLDQAAREWEREQVAEETQQIASSGQRAA